VPLVVDYSNVTFRIIFGLIERNAYAVALMIAATSSSQTKPDESKSLWPSAISKK
jgi:hypothetical protein